MYESWKLWYGIDCLHGVWVLGLGFQGFSGFGFRGVYLSGVDEVGGRGGRSLLLGASAPPIYGILQGAPFGMRLGIMNFEPHLLEQAFH